MSADQIGEGTWTSISIRYSTAERLRAFAPGGGYDAAISDLFRQRAGGPPRVVTHLGSWKWLAACGGCGWYRILRGRRSSIDRVLSAHARDCRE